MDSTLTVKREDTRFPFFKLPAKLRDILHRYALTTTLIRFRDIS